MIYHILTESGMTAGIISTVSVTVGNKSLDTGFHVTTPDPWDLQKYLRFVADRGAKYVVIECSSHALAQGRLGNLKFDAVVFTNIKKDHLDWHGNWENYANSKAILIDLLKTDGNVILNRDDKEMYNLLSSKLKLIGLEKLIRVVHFIQTDRCLNSQ
jgi:UDP-N-acetylmuramoyl-L-alanyl-D-glutamate--2,6-diaminopimelate ligase